MAFFCFAELLVEFGSLPDFIYATTVILIDVLNMIYIKREKCRLKAEAANEAKVISDETILYPTYATTMTVTITIMIPTTEIIIEVDLNKVNLDFLILSSNN